VSGVAAPREPAPSERPAPVDLREEEVAAALGGVLDPELDESIVELGFVQRISIAPLDLDRAAPNEPRARVRVELRLPTYWCAPNFSWIMAEDVREALVGDPRIAEVEVVLADHHAAAEISAGVSSGRAFEEVFGAGPDGRLVSLRELFRRKALLARQDRALKTVRVPQGALAGLRIGDLPDTEEVRSYLAARAELGLDCSAGAPALTDAAGRPVAADRVAEHLRRARLMRVAIEGNSAFCRGLLATRYGEAGR
jgi:metal-sulfur cluster biosynthetic enzyme